ncbi:MAG: carotenoid biosynthesis protein [Gemmatimonadetes bacterium]|nr:carotenoid biosynthesis protein [Gemmatimonadota bacterium]
MAPSDTSPEPQAELLMRVAVIALVVHTVAHALSAIAFATFLIESYPAWINTPTNLRIMAFGLTWGGQGTVVLGAVAAFAFCAARIGWRATMIAFAVSFVLSLAAELVGTDSGYPFGPYSYSGRLGYKILDLVPFNIPTSWFYLLVGCLAICGRLLPARDDATSKWWWAFVAGLVLTAYDVSMDPAMVKTHHWMWHPRDFSHSGALEKFLAEPVFYGMPLTNWLGWLLTGTLVTRAMLVFVPPTTWARHVAPSRFPLLLYAVNGFLPLAICFAQDMIPAGIIGGIAMGLPLVAAWRRHPAASVTPAGALRGGPAFTTGD